MYNTLNAELNMRCNNRIKEEENGLFCGNILFELYKLLIKIMHNII